MKHYLFLFFLVIVLFSSCKKEEQPNIDISIPESLEIPCEGGSMEFSLKANIPWQAKSHEQWLTVSPNLGSTESSSITVSVQINPSEESRSGVIIVSDMDGNHSKQVTLTQKGYSFSISRDKWTPASSGESIDVIIDSEISWESICDKPWVKISQYKASPGKCAVTLTAESNGSEPERTAVVRFYNQEYNLSKTITIVQMKTYIALSSSSMTFDWKGGSESLVVTSNCEFDIVPSASWIQCSSIHGVSGDNTISITTDKNQTNSTRQSSVVFKDNSSSVCKEITITQSIASISLDLFNWKDATWDGETKRIKVTSECAWSASCSDNWVTIAPASGDPGDTFVDITLSSNPMSTSRNSSVKFICDEITASATLSLTQKASYLSVSPTSLSSKWDGGKFSITISSDCDWTCTPGKEWIIVSSNEGNRGSKTITVDVAKNTTTSTRSGEISIVSKTSASSTRVIVNQEVAQVSLSTQSLNYQWSGETLSLTVTSNCPWEITDLPQWISASVTAGSSGMTGLSFTLSKNDGNSQRTYTASIINKDSNVKQEVLLTQKYCVDYVDEYGINHGKGIEIDGVTWAPVNLGYKRASEGDKGYPFGKLYQWGRTSGQGGYEQDDQTTYTTYSPTSWEGSNGAEDKTVYYGYRGTYHSWISIFNMSFWSNTSEVNPQKAQYDPCPKGWRIASRTEMENVGAHHSAIIKDDGIYGVSYYGSSVSGINGRILFLPACGGISSVDASGNNTYKFEERGSSGYYWTSSPGNNTMMPIRCYYSGSGNLVFQNYYCGCAYAIRCVKE